MGSIGWGSCNGGLAAVDSSIEEDRDHNMVVTTTIRAATAIVIRSVAPSLFGRDCVWRVKASVELIGWSPVADMRTQIERAALRRYFSLGKKVAVVANHPAKTRRHVVKLTHRFAQPTPEKRAARSAHGRDRPSLRNHGTRRGISHTVPQSHQTDDTEGRSRIYVPITQDGKVVRQSGIHA
jgi:hypothetical protein